MIPSLEQEKYLARLPKSEQGRARQAIFRASIEADKAQRDNLLSGPQASLTDPTAQALFKGIDPAKMRVAGYTAAECAAFCAELSAYKKKLQAKVAERTAHIASLKSRLADVLARTAAIKAQIPELRTKAELLKNKAANAKATPWQSDSSRPTAKPAPATQSPSASRPYAAETDQALLYFRHRPEAAAELHRRGWKPSPNGKAWMKIS